MVAYIGAYRDQFGVEPICRALPQAGVRISPSAYYAARARPPRARAVRDAALEKQILRVWKDSGERYGAWKVWDQLNREGIAAARCTVGRLMRKPGLRGVRRGGYKVRTTHSDPSQSRPADLVNRDFAPDAPDRLQLVDFTFVPTWAGTSHLHKRRKRGPLMAQSAPAQTKINTKVTQPAPGRSSRRPAGRPGPGRPPKGPRVSGEARNSVRQSARPVIELEFGILAYPPETGGEPWRAVFTENGQRRFRQGATEAKLAAKLEKVRERLRAEAANMEPPAADLIRHYLDPDRLCYRLQDRPEQRDRRDHRLAVAPRR